VTVKLYVIRVPGGYLRLTRDAEEWAFCMPVPLCVADVFPEECVWIGDEARGHACVFEDVARGLQVAHDRYGDDVEAVEVEVRFVQVAGGTPG
jgi:hypothetical protein